MVVVIFVLPAMYMVFDTVICATSAGFGVKKRKKKQMKFSRVKQFLNQKKVIRTGACVLAAVIVTGGVGAYHVYGQKAKTAQETTQERDADTEDRFADAEDVLTQVLKTQDKNR